MPEALLAILKICLLALLYLFFLRVLRAVWSEIRAGDGTVAAAVPATSRRPRRDRRPPRTKGAPQLRVVEPAERAGLTFALGDELTLGRAAGCQITLDDSYVSQLHARVFQRDGQVLVEDLGSTNGTYLNRKRVSGPMIVKRGDRLQVGQTVLELR